MELAAAEQLPKAELRNFGLVLGALFAALFGVLPLLGHRALVEWPWIVAASLCLAAQSHVVASRVDARGACAGMVQYAGDPDPDFHDSDHAVQLRDVDLWPRPDETRLRPQVRELPGAESAAS